MYEELKEMLEKELKAIIKKGELSTGSLDVIDKLTHSLKSITALEGGHSGRSYRDGSYGDRSYARRGRDGDGDGRYSEDSFRSYTDRSYDNYSGSMKRRLEEMMNEATNEKTRMAIMECLNRI